MAAESKAGPPDTTCSQLLRILADGSRAQLGIIHEAIRDLSGGVDSTRQELLARVQRSVSSLGTLISNVSDFHAYSAGRLDEAETDFDLRVTVEGIRERLSQLGMEPGWVAIARIRPETPTLLRGRPARLQDILLGAGGELLSQWSEGVLRIDVSMGSEQGGTVELVFRCELRPSGEPRAAEIEAFRERLSADAAEGPLIRQRLRTQLARRLASAAGGRLEAIAERDTALEFELRLPFTLRTAAPLAPAAQKNLPLRGRRVLIADVSESRRARMHGLLRLWGLDPVACESKDAALAALQQSAAAGTPIELLLVDSEFEPEGIPCPLAQADLRGPARAILLYGVGLRGDAALAEQSGFDAYLPRAISVHELREAMETLLQRAAQGATNSPIVTRHSLADERLEGVQILLVSDDAVGALTLESVLRRRGFHVHRARNVAEGGTRCEQTACDFLILDSETLSVEDRPLAAGLKVMLDERGRTAVAVLVGAQEERQQVIPGISPDATFLKPVDLEQICAFCERALYPEPGGTSSAPSPPPGAILILGAGPEREESAVFEALRLAQSAMGVESLEREVVRAYLEGIPRRLESVVAALQEGDLARAESEALNSHVLAMASGAVAVARSFEALAHRIRMKQLELIPAIVSALHEELASSMDAMRRHAGMGDDQAPRAA